MRGEEEEREVMGSSRRWGSRARGGGGQTELTG